ncbi:Organic hydroperoxide resistance transcriptional regulator [Microbacterium oxydans]|uniref:Organic hydroperoxide resistance transcriptional regulator n=2 Tax=Microbacterium oxydans TaxID=82380 RepID=A0A0F0KDV8_9MICO|nr:Organic hydroperoxide resistance transcriptional regulator [Microbacterium oxydans]
MLCFSLYSAARATTQAYRKLLAPWGLTYPQYLVLAALWLDGDQTIGSLGEVMRLDSGTLSPLVRRLEQAGLVTRTRSRDDERVVTVTLTDKGQQLRSEVAPIHTTIASISGLQDDETRRRLVAELHDITERLQTTTTELADAHQGDHH